MPPKAASREIGAPLNTVHRSAHPGPPAVASLDCFSWLFFSSSCLRLLQTPLINPAAASFLFGFLFFLQRVSCSLDFRFRGLKLLSTGRKTSIARLGRMFPRVSRLRHYRSLWNASTNYPPNLWVSLSFARFSPASHLRPTSLYFLACILLVAPTSPCLTARDVAALRRRDAPDGPNRRHCISGSPAVRLWFQGPGIIWPAQVTGLSSVCTYNLRTTGSAQHKMDDRMSGCCRRHSHVCERLYGS